MSETLDPSVNALNDCGCCSGSSAETPALIRNREGLNRIEYRVGTHRSFKSTMQTALTRPGRPKLERLSTRDDDDFTIALLDAWATTADVLTFYQERLANELYLRTATEVDSVQRLAQLIGYELKPAVAAQTWLAFGLETTPGSPEKALIAAGSKVQSVPGQDEKPQTFETVEGIEARAEWNGIKPLTTEPSKILLGAKISDSVREMFLKGTANQLQPGDAILIVGDEREKNAAVHPDKERWDVRVLTRVTVYSDILEPEKSWTRVEWEHPLGMNPVDPAGKNVRAYVFRQRAALYGHNAPDPTLIRKPDGTAMESWANYSIQNGEIDLDSNYPKIVPGSWLALMRPPDASYPRGYVELYKAQTVSFPSRSSFALSGKVTRIKPDTTEHLDHNFFPLDTTLVLAQSEQLEIVAAPRTSRPDEAASKPISLLEGTLAPVEGTRIEVDRSISELSKGRKLIISGKRIRALVTLEASGLVLAADADSQSKELKPGDTLVVLQLPAIQPGQQVKWRLRHDEGIEGTLVTALANLTLTVAGKDDPLISEQALVHSATGHPTVIHLAGEGLQNIYDRATVSVAANVAIATHGETVEEFAGSGNATQPFQKFTLRQTPLTFARNSGSSGMKSTLEVRVDDLLWREVPSLYGGKPGERIYVERQGDLESTTIQFGDGFTGARLPTGQQNIRLKYRKGAGLEGQVRARQLTQLLTRPLGVKDVVDPLPAEGADEAESLVDARRNAPFTVLTLERVVSLQDYEDFTLSYPGVAKALATWMWDGAKRGVFLTVAGPKGAGIGTGPGSVANDLLAALTSAGDPFVPLQLKKFREAFFKVSGTLTVAPGHPKEKVIAAAREMLRSRFSFEARSFGQPVLLSEIIAVLHSVHGVVAVDIDLLERVGEPETQNPAPRLVAGFPGVGSAAEMEAAELLLLAPGDLEEIKAAP